jgi:hypothetical protein
LTDVSFNRPAPGYEGLIVIIIIVLNIIIAVVKGRRGTRIDYWWESQRERDH